MSKETFASPKPRNSNLELFRIIVMLLIVAHHYVVNSGLMPIMAENPTSAKSMFLYLFGWAGKTGIDCFVLITGYFMCKSDISLKKFLKLFGAYYFYKLLFFLHFRCNRLCGTFSKICHQVFDADKIYKRWFRQLFPCVLLFHPFLEYFD